MYSATTVRAETIDNLIESYRTTYEKAESGKTYDEAKAEVLNDAIGDLLSTDTGIERLVQWARTDSGMTQAEQKTFFEKIKEWLTGMVNALKNLVKDKNLTGNQKALIQMELDHQNMILDKFFDMVDTAAENAKNSDGTVEDGTQYSVKVTSKLSLKEQLKKYYRNQMASSDAFYFGNAVTKYGLADAPIAMTQRAYKKSTTRKHNIPRRVLNNLAKNLSQPLFSFRSGNKIAYLINDIDGDGKKVLVAVDTAAIMDRQRVNSIDSIYGIDEPEQWIANQIKNNKEFALYDKKEANAFLQTYGYLALVGESGKSFIQKISQSADNVNANYSLKTDRRLSQLTTEHEVLAKSSEDKAYAKALLRGDIATAQKIVNAADIGKT